MSRSVLKSMAAIATSLFATNVSQGATVIFQSLPTLTGKPTDSFCSGCGAPTRRVYDVFSLSSTQTITAITFAVQTSYYFPTDIYIDFVHQISTLPGIPGFEITTYHYNTSDFVSAISTPFDTTLVTVNIPNLTLAAGGYDVGIYNPTYLGIPGFAHSGGQLYETSSAPLGEYTTAFKLYSGGPISPIPEPATWGMFVGAFGVIGIQFRRKKITFSIS